MLKWIANIHNDFLFLKVTVLKCDANIDDDSIHQDAITFHSEIMIQTLGHRHLSHKAAMRLWQDDAGTCL